CVRLCISIPPRNFHLTNMLPPVRRDRIIAQLPECLPAAALNTKDVFHSQVKAPVEGKRRAQWDTAGQERFKCIASTYYRGAQAIIVVFDLSCVTSLDNARQWLEDAMKENDPSSVLLFLVGTKKDLSSPDQLAYMEQEAIRLSEEIRAEYWTVSAKSGESIREFFFRVASLTFEANVLAELEKTGSRRVGDIIRITESTEEEYKPTKRKPTCC
ncbi:ras-related protein Rab-34, partial [Salvelinus sp. IW2-2015]|uniref:ras-related protein Rab-34 n=1 Tax=Salvelinus sp. IW2-2015 TaxID=2691554 RepID=UPI0038D39481